MAGLRAAFLLLLAALAALPAAAQSPATFVTPGGAAIPLRVEEADGRTWFSVTDLAAALEGTLSLDADTRSFEMKLKTHTAIFGADAPLAVVDAKVVYLSGPVRLKGSQAFVDAEFLAQVLSPVAGFSFAWDPGKRVLATVRAPAVEITAEASATDVGETTKVVLRFSQPPQYRVEKGDDAVVLKFPGTRLVAATPERIVDGPRVSRIVLHPSEAVISLKGRGLSTNVYPLGSPPRLVVDVTRSAAGAPAPVGAGPAGEGAKAKARIVVLDAGHGGTEEGARGPGGLLEKEAMLALSRTMQEVLARRGYRVVPTRSSDASVSLEDRAATANGAKADLFVSLHANASRSPSAHGTEVFYLSLDSSDRAAALLAENENKAADTATSEKNAALRDLDLILWDLAQNQHLAASERLAEIIQGDFNRLLGVTTRGVKQAPFRVLIGVNAPAVLVEVAFITNPDEEKKLASEEFRRQTAETLAGSLDNFFRTSASVPPVPNGAKPPGR